MDTTATERRQSTRFLLLYALAWAGGSISYVPFLTLLLPTRVTDLTGADAVGWLAYIAFTGAIASSAANILFGWLSDVTRNRRGWVALGLLLSGAFLVLVPRLDQIVPLMALVAVWQIALNMMLGPLSAWAGDCVPDAQKGTLGGLLAFAPAMGALSGAIVTLPGFTVGAERFILVAAMVAICVLPVLLLGNPRVFPELMRSVPRVVDDEPLSVRSGRAARRMWLARLLVQIAEAALFAYLLVWFQSIDGAITDSDTARVFSGVWFASVPVAMLAGKWADRHGRPILPLALCAAISSVGLSIMAVSGGLALAVAGYFIFGVAAAVFLSLHAAQTLRVLPTPERRGRDLGLFNLTNTVPSLIMPWLTLMLVPVFGFTALFVLLAGLAAISSAVLVSIGRMSPATARELS